MQRHLFVELLDELGDIAEAKNYGDVAVMLKELMPPAGVDVASPHTFTGEDEAALLAFWRKYLFDVPPDAGHFPSMDELRSRCGHLWAVFEAAHDNPGFGLIEEIAIIWVLRLEAVCREFVGAPLGEKERPADIRGTLRVIHGTT